MCILDKRCLKEEAKLLLISVLSQCHTVSKELKSVLETHVVRCLDRKCQTDSTFGGSCHFKTEIGPFGEQQSALKLSHSGNVTCHTHLSSASAVCISSV